MKLTTCLFMAATFGALAAEPATLPSSPELGRAYVTIPYSELRALWEAAQPKAAPQPEPKPAPVPFLVDRAEMRLQLGEKVGSLDAEFDVELLGKDWQRVLLLGGEARMDKAVCDRGSVIWDEGYVLLGQTPGKSKVAMHLATKGSRDLTAGGSVKLKLGSASVKLLSVTGIPAGFEARVNGQAAPANKDGNAVIYLGGESGEVRVELAPPAVVAVAKPLPPIQASTWQTQSQVLVRVAEGRLKYATRVFARASKGSGVELTLALPANAGGLAVTGEDVADWAVSPIEDGRRMLTVRWKTRDVLDRELAIGFAQPQSPLAEQWALQAPAVLGDNESRHFYAILPEAGVELKADGLRPAVESRRLPEWMQAELKGAQFMTAEAGAEFAVKTHWLPVIATAEAQVNAVKAELRLVSDGATQTTIAYTIKHEAPIIWQLELPANVELLSCAVDGHAAKPVQRAEGRLELSIPQGADATRMLSTVKLVYSAKSKPLDPVAGKVALELPRTPLFIERMDWVITIPAGLEVSDLDGNLTLNRPTGDGAHDPRILALSKEFCRAEKPSVELFYQRRGLEN